MLDKQKADRQCNAVTVLVFLEKKQKPLIATNAAEITESTLTFVL